MKNFNLIVTAAGISQRYGKENKLFEKCGKSCVLIESIRPFLDFKEITKIIVMLDTTYFDEFMGWLSVLHLDDDSRITAGIGGETRTKTVKNALKSLSDDCEIVLVHDGARPYVSSELIGRIIKSSYEYKAVSPALKLKDNIAAVDGENLIPSVRDNFRLVQTPFAFDRKVFEKCYDEYEKDALDDITVIHELSGLDIHFVDGDEKNVKITAKADLYKDRVGCGYDIHRLQDGDGITLCGVKIPCKKSFIAHSDGDVPVHALMDAMLSAVGEKDIGFHFPVDDSKYDDISSMILLEKVIEICKDKGYRVSNASISIIAESPKLLPYFDEMRAELSKTLSIPASQIGIVVTTNEQVCDIGKGNAIAAYATVLMKAQ